MVNVPKLFGELVFNETVMLDVLVNEYGPEQASALFFKAGHKAGMSLAQNTINLNQDLAGFLLELRNSLQNNLLGILEIEEFNMPQAKPKTK